MLYLVTLVVLILLLATLRWDNRSVINPILMMVFLVFAYLSVTRFAYDYGIELLYNFLFGLGFIIIPILVFLSGLFLIYNGIVLLKKEGKSKANLLSLLMGLGIIGFFALQLFRMFGWRLFMFNKFFNITYSLISFSFLVFGFAFVGFMLYSLLYLIIPKKRSYDFIIIHGAGLLGGKEVTPLLEKRILKAVEAYHYLVKTNPHIKLIASGGQGADELVSEAQAIADYIKTRTDVPAEAVLLEDKSVSTYENLLFSKQLGESLLAQPRFLFVTNDYHVFRTSMYAKQIKMAGDGLGCATASYYIPSAFIREFVAGVVYIKWFFVALYVPFIVMLLASYM